jgi:steroid delta-isomerase-like uncharacterized protein
MSTEDNKALVRRFYQELWNRKNLAVANQLIAATYVFHMAGSPPGIPPGPEGFTQFVSVFFTAFPYVHVTIEDQVAEGDRVTTRWTSRGTYTGDLMGIAPTGKSVTITGISIDRFENGKVIESWDNFDQLGMLQQLGVVPSMG